MFPIRDHAPLYSFPLVNYLVIFASIMVFFLELSAPDLERFIRTWGFVPATLDITSPRSVIPLFTSVWLHGGITHLFMNVWFLHVFGDNIEDALGHVRYLLFYLFTGAVSILTQYLVSPDSTLPVIGASGAISGVAGAFFVLYRRTRIEAIVFGIWGTILLPATVFLGYWFIIQVFQGFGSLVAHSGSEGGVAWFAHIGGFVSGYLIARNYRKSEG